MLPEEDILAAQQEADDVEGDDVEVNEKGESHVGGFCFLH